MAPPERFEFGGNLTSHRVREMDRNLRAMQPGRRGTINRKRDPRFRPRGVDFTFCEVRLSGLTHHQRNGRVALWRSCASSWVVHWYFGKTASIRFLLIDRLPSATWWLYPRIGYVDWLRIGYVVSTYWLKSLR